MAAQGAFGTDFYDWSTRTIVGTMLWTEYRPVLKIGPKGALGSHEIRPIHSAQASDRVFYITDLCYIVAGTMAARGVQQEFIATHPFLYFVLDSETNVSLMAGQMLDPLNSRIY